MSAFFAGIVFWGVLAGMVWLARPSSRIWSATVEKWNIISSATTLLVLVMLIGSSCFLMSLCPMWNGETTRQLMEQLEAEKNGVTGLRDGYSDKPNDPDRYAIKNKNQYELMADALLEGRLYFDYDVDPLLLKMDNPYDRDARRELGVRYHWDHAFYKGKYYMYFGVVPVFLLFIPYRLITGLSLTTYHATQIFTGAAMVGLFAFFRFLSRKFFPKLSFAVYLMLGTAVCLSATIHCIAKPAMYMTAFAAGICMEVWSVYFFVKAVWGTKDENRAILLAFVGALLGALAFGCRPSIALGNLMVIPCLAVFLQEHKFSAKLFLKLAAAASPYIIIGVLLMAYNYVRFESAFEFGQSYQLTVADQSSYGSFLSRFNVLKLGYGVSYFLVISGEFVRKFPHIVETGVLVSYPVYNTGIYAVTRKKVQAGLKSSKLHLFMWGGVVTIAVIILADVIWSPYLLSRYKEDMIWLLGMMLFAAAGMMYAESKQGSAAGIGTESYDTNRKFSSVVTLLSILAILFCAALFVELDREYFTPPQLAFIKKIISGITFGLY